MTNENVVIQKKKLSLPRLLLLLLIIGFGMYKILSYSKVDRVIEDKVYNTKPWFAAYVDVTAMPQYSFEQLSATTNSNIVLSFIVSSIADPCIPTWGTFSTFDEAAINYDLDRRIARYRQQGGNISISFGGALNDELANKCTDEDKLYNAYLSVINKYEIDTIDLDLEGQTLSNQDAIERRAKVISRLQKDLLTDNKHLAVWLTLPVTPQGLTVDGTTVISKMITNGVDLAGVNVMTMDYGESKKKSQNMFDASRDALNETHRQLAILYKQAGINLSDGTIWKKIGATPMIGQNDITDEVFMSEDAFNLNAFATEKGIGRMSMWSANRDQPCGENYVNLKIVSNSCSGVDSSKLDFSQKLGLNFSGSITTNSVYSTMPEPETTEPIIDDPEHSPYQIWRSDGVYPKGVKVVWHKNVYEAKWWTKNDLPDNPVLQYWETPWQLIGPVLPEDKPIPQATLPRGTYPNWSGTVIYDGGDRVLFDGIPFQAKWWNQGESPLKSSFNPDNSPWIPLTQAQIEEILKNKQNH